MTAGRKSIPERSEPAMFVVTNRIPVAEAFEATPGQIEIAKKYYQ